MSGVLVVMEQKAGSGWNRMSFEALAAGQKLAAELGVACSAAVVRGDVAALATELTDKKLETVWSVAHPLLAKYTAGLDTGDDTVIPDWPAIKA